MMNFYYDPVKQGYSSLNWKTLSGTPTIVGTVLRFNADSAVQQADLYKCDLTVEAIIPVEPTTGDVRFIGFSNLGLGSTLGFDITDDVCSAVATDNDGNTTSQVITFNPDWAATKTSYTIQWRGPLALFFVNGQKVAELNDLAVPKTSMSFYINNGNADNMDVSGIDFKNVETINVNSGAQSFIELIDAPQSYVGQAGKFAKVNVAETGLEFGSGDGVGDVMGPASAVADNIAVYNLATGKIIKDGGKKISDLLTTSSVFSSDMMLDGAVAPDTYELLVNTGKVAIRKFAATPDQDVDIAWQPSYMIASGMVQFRVVMFISESTVPASGETIIFKLAGRALADSENLNKALGTAVGVTYTAPASGLAQYDKIATGWSGDVTITDLATLNSVRLNLLRDTANDTYGQKIGVAFLEVKYANS